MTTYSNYRGRILKIYLYLCVFHFFLPVSALTNNFLVQSNSFSCTKTIQNITVPTGANYMYVNIQGAAGGVGVGGTPGYGARVQSYFNVHQGDVLHVVVGCQGTTTAGGYNGGGKYRGSATSGGGASDIRLTNSRLSDRIIVAGGGGGILTVTKCGAQKGGDSGKFGVDGVGAIAACSTAAGKPIAKGGTWSSGGLGGGFQCVPAAGNG